MTMPDRDGPGRLPKPLGPTPELAFLMACLGATPLGEVPPGPDFDWKAFLFWVRRHRVQALTRRRLREQHPSGIPQQVLAALQAGASRETLRALKLALALQGVCASLSEAKVDHILLKGPALSQRLYGEPGLRQVRDLDLLIRPENRATALAVLSAQGYQPRHASDANGPNLDRWALGLHKDVELFHNGLQVPLELHWRTTSADPWGEWWFGQSRPVTGYGERTRELNALALPLFLCLHGGLHHWNRLKWLVDLADALKLERDIAWEALFATAQRLRLHRALGQGLLLASWLMQLPLPDTAWTVVRAERCIGALATFSVRSLCLRDAEGDRQPLSFRLQSIYWNYRLIPTHSPVYFLVQYGYSTKDYQALPLPEGLYWLYPFLRPVFWLQRHIFGQR